MLVAAKVDAEHPHRAAQVINEHPGVSHNYLRNHDFNLWFTIAVAPDSRARARRARSTCSQRLSGRRVDPPAADAHDVQDQHEPRDGGRHRGARRARSTAEAPRELEPQPFDDFDVAVIRALQGPMAVRSDAYAPAAARAGRPVERLLDHCAGMVERKLLRRVAAILFHRRAGFSANGMGVWKVPEEQIAELGPRMAAVRGVSHCYQRPTYADWPYCVFTMAHGRSKEECDAVLDASPTSAAGIDDRATLYSSTEFKKVRLRYFTPDYAWEARHALSVELGPRRVGRALPRTTARSELYERAPRAVSRRREQPGARDARGRPRPALHRRAARAPSSSTSTATATSTTCAPGAR